MDREEEMDMASQRSPGTICIGLLGQPRTGKSTLLDTLLDTEHPDGMKTTLRLTCANATIYKCSSSDNPCYRSCISHVDMAGRQCDSPGHELNQMSVWKHVSFVDCPGDIYHLDTMLAGIVMTDGVFVLSTPSEEFCLGRISEILAAANAMGKSIVILQNHMEEESANEIQVDQEHLRQIRELTDLMSISREIPVVGLSVMEKANEKIGELCQHIDSMSTPEADVTSPALMIISDSFALKDAGKGDGEILVTIHGRVTQGVISTNQLIEVRPGVLKQGDDRKPVCCPIILKVIKIDPNVEDVAVAGHIVELTAVADIMNADLQLESVIRGGLRGHKLGRIGSMPGVYSILKVKVELFTNMFSMSSEELEEVVPIKIGQEILLSVGTVSSHGKVHSIPEDMTIIVVAGLTPPACASEGEQVFISRKQGLAWTLVGHGQILAGRSIKVVEPILPAE